MHTKNQAVFAVSFGFISQQEAYGLSEETCDWYEDSFTDVSLNSALDFIIPSTYAQIVLVCAPQTTPLVGNDTQNIQGWVWNEANLLIQARQVSSANAIVNANAKFVAAVCPDDCPAGPF